MSSKRKSPPTKLEGGGTAIIQNNNNNNTNFHQSLGNNNSSSFQHQEATAAALGGGDGGIGVTGGINIINSIVEHQVLLHSPSISSEIGCSEPDIDSYRSSSPANSDIELPETRIAISESRGVELVFDIVISTEKQDEEEEEEECSGGEVGGDDSEQVHRNIAAIDPSEYDHPCKKQRLDLNKSPTTIFPVSINYI